MAFMLQFAVVHYQSVFNPRLWAFCFYPQIIIFNIHSSFFNINHPFSTQNFTWFIAMTFGKRVVFPVWIRNQ